MKRNILIGVLLVFSIVVLGATLALQQYTFYSPTAEYDTVEGTVQISTHGELWGYNNISLFEGGSWFARFVTAEGYKGNVSVTWNLQKYVEDSWIDQNITQNTYAYLSGKNGHIIYCSSWYGHPVDNFNWGSMITAEKGDQFRVKVDFATFEGALP